MSGCGGQACQTCDCAQDVLAETWNPVEVIGERAFDGGTVEVRTLLAEITAQLAAAGVPSPAADARILLSHLVDRPANQLGLLSPISTEAADDLRSAARRRATREPLQHVLGTAWFRQLTLAVGPGVFVPRPETESVVEAALGLLPSSGPIRVAELGAGSGAIALALATERPQTTVYAVELDPTAMRWFTANVRAHADLLRQVESRIVAVLGDAGAVSRTGQPLAPLGGSLPLVIANPPYIPDAATPRDVEVRDYDPDLALYGGPDGLAVIRRWLNTAADLLAPGGALVMEHADAQGADDGLPGLLSRHEDTVTGGPVWRSVTDHQDLAGRPRYTVAHRS